MKSLTNPGTVVVVVMLTMVILLSSLARETEARWAAGRRYRGSRTGRLGRVVAWPGGRYSGLRRTQRDQAPSGGHHYRVPRRHGWSPLFRLGSGQGRVFTLTSPYAAFLRGPGAGAYAHPWSVNFGLGYGRQPNWWEGPHVCRSEETENGSDSESNAIAHHFRSSSQVCEGSDTAYKCTTTIQSANGKVTKVELHECCHGYSRKPEDFGCPQEVRLADLPTTARTLGLNDMLRAVSLVGMDEELARGNFTLFAPVDGSFSFPSRSSGRQPSLHLLLRDQPFSSQSGAPLMRSSRQAIRRRQQPRRRLLLPPQEQESSSEDDLENVVLGHLLPEPRRASSFSDEDVLQTGSPLDSTIRVNFYSRPEKLTTANCVKVKSTDNLATNGVIHVVEKALPTVTSSLVDLVRGDKQFSYLKTALARAHLVSDLQKDGQFTLLAPTNAAFQRLDKGLLDQLLSGDSKCLDKVVKHHVLPNVICSTVIQGLAKSRNLLNSYVNLTRTNDSKLFVNDAQVVRVDVMATNGVMHVIDDVLIPDDALDLLSVAKKNGLTEYVQLTDAAGLTSAMRNASDVTLFAPSNEAIQALSPEVMKKLRSDPELLQSVLQYHVVPKEMSCRLMYANRRLDTLNPKAQVLVNEYSSFPFGRQRVTTVQCAPITRRHLPSCNGLLHVIDRVLLPPSGNLVDVLAADSAYSTFVRLMKMAGLADSLQEEGSLTVFAPTNKAFQQLGKETLKKLEGNREQLASLLQLHILQGHLCCSGIFHGGWWNPQRIQTLSGRVISLSRDRRGQPLVNDVVIGSCDNTATNGVVHGIESVLTARRRNPWFAYRRY